LEQWQIDLIKRRLAEYRGGAETVPHEEVAVWLDSKGTEHELPMPGSRSPRLHSRR
jgi:predicted transcriptional regulator